MEKRHYFTKTEKKEFLTIAKKYQTIIESKAYDSHTLRRKNITWDRIACQYNTSAISPYPASSKQLRRLWMNLKQRNKKSVKTDQEQSSDADIDNFTDHNLETGVDVEEITIGETPAFRLEFIDERNVESIQDISTNDQELTKVKKTLLIREFHDKRRKLDELHMLQKRLLMENIREARAKANLAELELKQHTSQN